MAAEEENFAEEYLELVIDIELERLLKSFELSTPAVEEFISKYF